MQAEFGAVFDRIVSRPRPDFTLYDAAMAAFEQGVDVGHVRAILAVA